MVESLCIHVCGVAGEVFAAGQTLPLRGFQVSHNPSVV
jgi:hypothetical protein